MPTTPEAKPHMTEEEQRQVLEAIARDPGAYPRDRIAAVKALHELGLATEQASNDDLYLQPVPLDRKRAA